VDTSSGCLLTDGICDIRTLKRLDGDDDDDDDDGLSLKPLSGLMPVCLSREEYRPQRSQTRYSSCVVPASLLSHDAVSLDC